MEKVLKLRWNLDEDQNRCRCSVCKSKWKKKTRESYESDKKGQREVGKEEWDETNPRKKGEKKWYRLRISLAQIPRVIRRQREKKHVIVRTCALLSLQGAMRIITNGRSRRSRARKTYGQQNGQTRESNTRYRREKKQGYETEKKNGARRRERKRDDNSRTRCSYKRIKEIESSDLEFRALILGQPSPKSSNNVLTLQCHKSTLPKTSLQYEQKKNNRKDWIYQQRNPKERYFSRFSIETLLKIVKMELILPRFLEQIQILRNL